MSFPDEYQRLRDNPRLAELLSHYALLGRDDRSIWQDRVMSMEGLEAKELSRLHGELIAFDWIEQNTGQTAATEAGTVAACYRVTLQGLRDNARRQGAELETQALESEETPKPRFPRKKKKKAGAVEVLEGAVMAFPLPVPEEPAAAA